MTASQGAPPTLSSVVGGAVVPPALVVAGIIVGVYILKKIGKALWRRYLTSKKLEKWRALLKDAAILPTDKWGNGDLRILSAARLGKAFRFQGYDTIVKQAGEIEENMDKDRSGGYGLLASKVTALAWASVVFNLFRCVATY